MKPQQLEKLAQNPHFKMTKEQLDQLEHHRKYVAHNTQFVKHGSVFQRNNKPMEREK